MRLVDVEVKERDERGRANWTFAYRSVALIAPCQTRAAFHRGRETYWAEQTAELEAKMREKGIELREQQVTGGTQFSAVVDPDLARRLGDAKAKHDHHRAEARTFEAYVGVFLATDATYHLTIADIDYFGLYREDES